MALGNLTLNLKVYTPVQNLQGITKWQYMADGIPNGYSSATLSVKEPASGVKNYRSTGKLLVPVVKGEDSTCGCVGDFLRQIGYEVTMTADRTSTGAERTDAYLRFKDFVATPEFIAVFRDLTPQY
jgi:hypothetical protein